MKKDKLFMKEKPVIGMIHTNHTDEESSLQRKYSVKAVLCA